MPVRSLLICWKTLYRMYVNNTGRFVSLPASLSHFRLFFFSHFRLFFSLYVPFNTLDEPLSDVHKHYWLFYHYRLFCLTSVCFVSLPVVLCLYVRF